MAASSEPASPSLDAAREALIRQVTHMLFPAPLVLDPRGEWTTEQATMLEQGGLSLAPLTLDQADNPLSATIAAYTTLVTDSLDLEAVAARLAVSTSRIRQRLGEHSLYGFKWESRWRLPPFQFVDHHILPGLGVVLPALDPGLSPLDVVRWFHVPDPDLELHGRPASPVEWLAGGHDPAPVRALAASLSDEL
jgi:hypothetical protein